MEDFELSNFFRSKDSDILSLIDENTFIISDTHFGHDNITTFEPCRVEAMMKDGYEPHEHDKWLIEQWNDTVGDTDIVLHLGDFAFKGIQETQPLLKGRKILLLGNHDRKGIQTYKNFEYIIRGLWIENNDIYSNIKTDDELFSVLVKTINNKRIMFSHYPSTPKEIEYSKNPVMSARMMTHVKLHDSILPDINVHGHTHSKQVTREGCNFINVSTEVIGFKPIKIKNILN